LFNLTLQLLLFRLVALLVVVAVQGFVIAATARLLGDPGPRYDGRLTPNPLVHLDPIGSIGAVLFQLGWMKPVAVETAELRRGRGALVAIAIAGIAALIVLAILLQLLKRPALILIGGNFGLNAVHLLDVAARLALWFAAFNVLPVPPLTGGLLLRAAVPRLFDLAERYRFAVIVVLALLIVSGIGERVFQPVFSIFARVLTS
jgi:Zn-dependent protease